MIQGNRKSVKTLIGLGAGLLCAVFVAPGSAQAASMSFNFSGSVERVLGGVFTPGGYGADGFVTSLAASGGGTYNMLTTDRNSSPNVGFYRNAIQDFSVSVGTYVASFAPGTSFISVMKNAPRGGPDIYELRVDGLSGEAVNGFKPARFVLRLTDPTGTAFSNDRLPAGPPSLSSFASSQFRLIFGPSGITNRVQGGLTSLVPLPAAVWLFGAGLIALVGLGSRGLVSRKES